jgi:PAS domain S-box-containing protein
VRAYEEGSARPPPANPLEIAENAPALIFTLSADGEPEFINSRWSQLTGVPVEQLLRDGWHSIVHPADAERAAPDWARSMLTGEPFAATYRLRASDGSYRPVLMRVESTRDDGGGVLRWVGSGLELQVPPPSEPVAAGLPELLADIARGAFGGLADLCCFDLWYEDGRSQRVVVTATGVDPQAVAILEASPISDLASLPKHPVASALEREDAVYVERVDDAWMRRSAGTPERYAMWCALGFHSLVSVPLRVDGRVLGAMTLLRTRSPRPFDPVDVRVISEIGRRVGVALEIAERAPNLRPQAQDADARFRSLADLMPQIMWTMAPDGTIEWYNRRWYEYTGHPYEAGPADDDDFYHPDDVVEVGRRWALCQASGEPFEMEYRIRRHDGVYRWFLTRAGALRDQAGRIVRWYGSDTDVDDVRRAARRLQFFADVGESLSVSLGLADTLTVLMESLVPEFADWGFVNLMGDDGRLRVAAVQHQDPEKRALLEAEVGRPYALDGNALEAVRTLEPVLHRNAGYDEAAEAIEPALLEVLRDVGFNSVVAVPLIVRGRVRGTLNLVMSDSERTFSIDDVPFFRELARHFAPAIANAESYEHERRVARSFQEAALPVELPKVPGYHFSAIYEAGNADALIGGDWYDAFQLVDGRIVISIGDVAGSGLEAAVTMASVRQALRGVAQVHADPALMLEAADRTLRAEAPDRFVTAFVGVIDNIGETLVYANAGHPAPILRRANGTLDELDGSGPPLGLREHVRGGGRTIPWPADGFLVLYTDGLIEATQDIAAGLRRLQAALANPAVLAAADPAYAIFRSVLLDVPRDDVAILTVRSGDPPRLDRWLFNALDPGEAYDVAAQIRMRLRAAGYSSERLVTAELVIAELIGNTVRHAPGTIEVLLELGGAHPVVHVLDRGPGFEFAAKLPLDPYSETGRGLFLISTLAEDLHVERRADGGSHARVVLPRPDRAMSRYV